VGSLSRPGPGLFPVMISATLLVIALVMIGRSFITAATPLNFQFRNITLIGASLISFALISEYVNMIAGIVVMATMASYASEDFSIPRAGVIAGALCLVAVAMKKLLGVQLPLY